MSSSTPISNPVATLLPAGAVVAPEVMRRHVAAAPVEARRLEFIDALRGFACLWVIFCHVHGYWLSNVRVPGWGLTAVLNRVAGYGGRGVDLFIVLSGFCLYWPLVTKGREREPFRTGQFYRRRAWRILPAYYVALAVCTLLVLIPSVQPMLVARPVNGVDVATHLFLVQTWSPSTTPAINGSFWSLALEVELYALFPVLLLVGRRFSLRGILSTVVVVAAAWQLLEWHLAREVGTAGWASVMSMHLPARWVQSAAGMIAAACVARPGLTHLRRAVALLGVSLPIAILDQPRGILCAAAVHAVWGIVFGAAVVIASRMPSAWFGPAGVMRPLTAIGVVSYSLYLVQQPFLLMTSSWVNSLGWSMMANYALAAFAAVPLMLAIAFVMYRAVERPFMRR